MTAPNLLPGASVAGKFTVRSLLGFGGSAATYRAVSPQGREVALKVFSPMVGQRPDAMEMLQRYVAETNALPPDLCAHVVEAGYDPATTAPFTATDFLPIPSVAQVATRRPLSTDEVGSMLRTLAAVLDAAHVRGVFHHAIKPTNVFIDPNAPGNAKLTDFGVGLSRSVVPTQEGYVVSAPWMAPEQVQPTLPAGAGTDVFSAALLAFFALTGRSYWRSCQGAADLAAWQHELFGPRSPASTRGAELGVPVSQALDSVFARALAVDPRERYRTVGELAAAFTGFPTTRADTAATLAFPTPGYEPPPQPMVRPAQPGPGGYGAPQGYGAPYPPPPGVAVGDYPPPPEPMQFGGPGPAPPVHAQPLHIGQPTLAAIGPPTPPPSSRAVPIVVGAVAVLLLGGAAAAFFLIRRTEGGPQPATPSSAVVATTAPTDTGPPTTAAADSGAPATPPPVEADAGAGNAGAGDVLVKLTCAPEACEQIVIAGKPVTDLAAELRLKPGVYQVSLKRSGYFAKVETIRVEAGKPFEKEFTLTVIPKGPGPGPTQKKCGKFLKRCD